jgi:hypothetical protein
LFLESVLDVFLETLHLLLELLISKLQLLNHSGELANLIFQSIHAYCEIRGHSLRLTLARGLAAEHPVEGSGFLGMRRAAAHQRRAERGSSESSRE